VTGSFHAGRGGKVLCMGQGVEELREKRGEEEVTFGNVCDHLNDYADRHPEARETVEDFARFVANVEDIDHDHEGRETRGMQPGQDAPH
jgi:hypothetical protein